MTQGNMTTLVAATAEYRSLEEARASIARWIEEYNHDRPHRGSEIALRMRPSWLSQFT